MYKIVCAKIDNDYFMISRTDYKAFKIPKELYSLIKEMTKSNNCLLPEALSRFIYINFSIECNVNAKELITFRKTERNFHAASYEITEKCNFRCKHCYLEEKNGNELVLEKKQDLIHYINDIGCLWLQITGGEPLLSEDFEEIYLLSYSLGMLLTVSTNGSFILRYRELFKKYPPYRLAISLYGAKEETYKKVTGVSGYFPAILNCLKYLRRNKLRTRVNIIILKDNYDEVNEMESLARKYELEYHVYNKISPGLSGSNKPLSCIVEHQNFIPSNKGRRECYAGRKFFHINSTGKASICKIARSPNLDILAINQDELINKLHINSKALLKKPETCLNCSNWQCQTCPPLLGLYKKAGYVPAYICQKGVNPYG